MRVGLLSDTHDRVPAVRALLEQMVAGGVSLVMHAGDYCSPFSLQPFHDLSLPLLGVFGRNDGDRDALQAAAKLGFGALELYESPHSFEIGGKNVLLIHDLADVHQRSIDGQASRKFPSAIGLAVSSPPCRVRSRFFMWSKDFRFTVSRELD